MRRDLLRRALAAGLLLAAAASAAIGAEDPLARGTRLFEKRHYSEAAAALRPWLSSSGSRAPGQAALVLGAAYLKNAELHRALFRAAVPIQLDYLNRLAGEKGRGASSLADLYLGEALMAAGRFGDAKAPLARFLGKARKGSAESAIAAIDLGLCQQRQGEAKKARASWSGVNAADPEVKAQLAAAYLVAGGGEKASASMCDEALAAIAKSGRRPSIRTVRCAVGVYAASGLIDKGLDLLTTADLRAFSREEVLGKDKVIRFYDPALLEAAAALYGKAAVAWLGKAAADARSRDTAAYYLEEARALPGVGAVPGPAANPAASRMPQSYQDRAAVRQAAGRFASGQKAEALRLWDEMSRKQPVDPDLLAEIVAASDRVGADCRDIVGRAGALSEAGEGKRFRALHFALGRHYLGRKEYARALFHLEAARDKGNKNKVESNEPEMLAAVAEAYYRVRKFSEAQEIFFEMNKSYPAVRQVQEALQGVYAREQKSAGDARIL